MITFLGDVSLISDDVKSSYVPKDNYVFNLEYVVAGEGSELKPVEGKINLKSSNSDFFGIFKKEPLAVCVANNHICDFGKDGFEETVENIKLKNIGIIGTEPLYIDGICFLSYTALGCDGGFEFSEARAKNDIEAARKNGSKAVIVQMHWGIENHPSNNKKQTAIGHFLIDCGADLVIGHHPHCIQPAEEYKGKYIFYSLGNGLFPNISKDSHYNSDGVPQRHYRFNWRSWNRESLAVTYDENENKIAYVDVLYQRKNTLTCKKKEVPPQTFVKKPNSRYAGIRYTFRKYYLFFVSNLFVDGKIFDMNALRAELKKKG